MSIRGFFCQFLFFFLIFPRFSVAGVDEKYDWSSNDFSMYPEYCRARLDRSAGDLRSVWEKRIGKGYFVHIHHFCFGLKSLSLAYLKSGNKFDKELFAKSSIKEFEYVLKHTDERFPLLAELYFSQAKGYSLLGDVSAADRAFSTASRLNPVFVDIWVYWSDLYFLRGDKRKAVEVLQSAPESLRSEKKISLRLQELSN